MQPEFIMLVGMPGSGKSTYRTRFTLRWPHFKDFTTLSTDDKVERIAMVKGSTYDAEWADNIKSATSELHEDFQKCIKERRSMLLDRTNLTVKARRGFLAPLPKAYKKVAIYFEIDEGLRQQRVAGREGKSIPADAQEDMLKRYVRPTLDEGFDLVLDGVVLSGQVAA